MHAAVQCTTEQATVCIAMHCMLQSGECSYTWRNMYDEFRMELEVGMAGASMAWHGQASSS